MNDFVKIEAKENIVYISPNLIQQITKTNDLRSVTKLNLCIAKQWKRKIQVTFYFCTVFEEKTGWPLVLEFLEFLELFLNFICS